MSTPNLISTQDAIYHLNSKILALEGKLVKTVGILETKLGNHETYVSENLPDLDVINSAFSDINKRLLDLESLNDRIVALETNANIKPAASKKKSTLKLNELTDATAGPGLSFTS
jgi:hypothetical protein